MNAGRDVERLLSDWLVEEAPSGAPDRIVLTASDRIDHTKQRRFGVAWRFPSMNAPLRVAVAAVIGVLLLGGAYYLFGGGGGPEVGAPATPTPTTAPSPTPYPLPTTGVLAPGSYVTDAEWADPTVDLPVTVTLPSGWASNGGALVRPPEAFSSDTLTPDDAMIMFWVVGQSYTDPCHSSTSAMVPGLGPTVDDLANALLDQVGTNATAPTTVTIDGHAGQFMTFDVPADLDASTCDFSAFRVWSAHDQSIGLDYWSPSMNGVHNLVWIVEVPRASGGRSRLVIIAVLPPDGTREARDEVETIVGSIEIGSPAAVQ